MAIITNRKGSSSRSIQDMGRIEGFSEEPFFISDNVENELEFDSIVIDEDGTTFTEILAYELNKKDTYDYMTQCNFTDAKVFNLTSQPLVSPNGFASVTKKSGLIVVNR